MTDLKISELEDGVSAQAGDALPIARGGQNYYLTAQYIKNFVFGSNGTISIAAGKTFSVNNTITLNGNDGVSVNFGSGGTFVYSGGAAGTPSSITLTNGTGLPLTTGVTGTLPVANGGTGVTTSTGSGSVVLSTSPTLVTPILGTPTSGDFSTGTFTWPTFNQNTTGTAAGLSATLAVASGGTGVTTSTGSGSVVLSTDPVFANDITVGTASSDRGEIILANTSANTVKLRSSNSTAANYTLTLPAAAPVNGYYLQTDNLGVLSWAAGGGGGSGSPGGSTTQVQFNDSATFGGEAAFTYDKTTYTLGLGVASTTTGTFKLYNSASANAVSLKSGNNSAAWTLTLPPDDGSANQFLQTDGSGNTIWAAAAAGTINTGTIGQLTYYSGTNALSGTTTGAGILTFLGTPSSANLAAAVTDETGSGSLVFGTSPTITTPTISGNETHTGTGALFLADFSNATVASRFSFQTSTTNGLTGIYALPNGTATGAAWQATNNSDPTNASKIMITTNASTDVQLVSGINGTGTYLPLSIYTNGGKSAEFSTTKGTFTLGVSGSTAGVLNIAGSTSGTVSIQGAAGAGTYNFNLPTSAGTSGQPLLSGGGGASSMTFGTLGVAGGGTGTATAFTAGSVVFAGASGTYTQDNANFFWDDTNNRLGIGTTSPTAKLQTVGNIVAGSNVVSIGSTREIGIDCPAAGTSSLNLSVNGTLTGYLSTSTSSANLFAYGASSPLLFGTNNTERVRVDAVGNVLVGGTAARATTVGAAHLDIFNGTAPAGTLTNGISLYSSSGDFNFMDASGNGYKVGFRNIPQVTKSATYTPTDTSDVGKHISTNSGVTVNASIYSAGDVFTIYNNSSSSITITAGTNVTFRLAGTATTGPRTLAQYGVATLLCVTGGATPTFVVSGGGVT